MYLEIISPESIVFKGEIDSISVPGSSGDFQVLNNHAPIISTLKKGIIKIKAKMKPEESDEIFFSKEGKETYTYKIKSGVIQVKKNKLILLSD